MKSILFALLMFCAYGSVSQEQRPDINVGNRRFVQSKWIIGCNYISSNAVNQLEMWQDPSFNLQTISRELKLASAIGINTLRVYLHHQVWINDSASFKRRIFSFLECANENDMKVIFVLFDDCWNSTYYSGTQPLPKIGVHNSQWLKDPGDRWYFRKDRIEDTLKNYVQDILQTFNNNDRILIWDLFNEPGWSGYLDQSLELSQKVFSWAREIHPTQPLTICVWNDDPKFAALNKFALENSDVVTYHNYQIPDKQQLAIDTLRRYQKPIICTEYMARKHGSTFQSVLPVLKKEGVGAISWGLVAGKTNTIYAWDEPMPDGSEPKLWFHDIFRKDGTPYDIEEINFIKRITMEQ